MALGCLSATGQTGERPVSAWSILKPAATPNDVLVPFSIKADGQRFTPTWGLDLAWINEQNLMKGVNHMGSKNVGIGRTSFRVLKPLVNDVSLTADQIEGLQTRSRLFDKVSKDLPLVFNCDNGYRPDGHSGPNINAYYTTNHQANINRWAAVIDAHVSWMKANTEHPIVGVSPFNEPDYDADVNLIQGTAQNEAAVARKLREAYAANMEGIAIAGGNTLNDDKALQWYTPGSDVYDWGNTHQLAGSMANYIAFHDRLQADGKTGYNDEMHNVVEAMTGLEHGMTVGIWWGFDSRARGEFCDISRNGMRLSYAEHRNNWTAASVYRHDDGRVKAFIGSSERQAATTAYRFVSVDHPVYYDGYGPCYEYRMEIPGGTGYQRGQTNAERVVDVTWGEDVQPYPIDGDYKIMNKYTKRLVAQAGNANGNMNISQMKDTGDKKQQWSINPVSSRIGGDYSFYDIRSLYDQRHIDVLNFSLEAGGNLIAWANDQPSSNEQWYLEYAGDGFFFIRNRESALYMTLESMLTSNGVNINQQPLLAGRSRDRQLWRIIPTDAECELNAPAQPSGLTATPTAIGVELQWTASSEADLSGYQVLRAERGSDRWHTIARGLTTTTFLDNSCRQGCEYEYRIKAIDRSANLSEPSASVVAKPTGAPSLVAQWSLDGQLNDLTPNLLDATLTGSTSTATYVTGHQTDAKALSLAGSQYLQLPYGIADSQELTVTLWINWRNSALSGQHIFDFGNGLGKRLWLTTSNKGLQYAISDGITEQTLDAPRLANVTWQHVAITIGRDKTTIYIDGQEAASAANLTITPADVQPVFCYVGHSTDAASNNLRAYIDDMRIYNYALDGNAVNQVKDGTYTAIHPATAAQRPSPTAYYSLDGQRHSQPQHGVNIVRYSDGTTGKIIHQQQRQ